MALKRTKVFGYTKRMSRDPRVRGLKGKDLGMFIFMDRLQRAGKLEELLASHETNEQENDDEKVDTE